MSQSDVEYEDEGGGVSWIVIMAVVVVIAAAVAFFAGRAMAGDSGPETLSEAVKQAQAGDLPCGDVGEVSTPGAEGPPAGGFGQGGAPNSDFVVRAICNQDGGQAQGGPPGGRGPGGFTRQVKSIDGTTLTLTGPQGDTTVELGPDTTVSRTTEGDTSDLKAGANVIITGGQQREPATSVLIVPGD